jgi:hypothetical protein
MYVCCKHAYETEQPKGGTALTQQHKRELCSNRITQIKYKLVYFNDEILCLDL